jgi:DNA-binding transcriptional regulator YiaG
MANLASVLRDEISRVTRREVRRGTSALKKASAAYRSEIAALKRRLAEIERRQRRAEKGTPSPIAASDEGSAAAEGTRFSARSMASQRRRLGLSAAECGLLVGASAQSIYNWEEGKTRPRAQHLPAIFALRNIGRREAAAHLESLKKAA